MKSITRRVCEKITFKPKLPKPLLGPPPDTPAAAAAAATVAEHLGGVAGVLSYQGLCSMHCRGLGDQSQFTDPAESPADGMKGKDSKEKEEDCLGLRVK